MTASETDRKSRALSWLALGAIAALAYMAIPLGAGLFLGALVAFTLQPIYVKLCARGMGVTVAAALCALATTLVIAVCMALLGALVVSRGLAFANAVPGYVAPGGAVTRFTEGWASALVPLHIRPALLEKAVQDQALSLGSSATTVAADVAGTTFGALLTFVFMGLSAFSVLRYWSAWMRHAESFLPFEPRHTHALFDEFRRVGRQVLRGTFVTGLIQGAAAAIVYWVTGVPDPLFLGVLTALASLLPAVGTLLIWVSVGVWLIINHHVAVGLTELGLASLFVGLIPDYVIRPRLVGSERGIPVIVTFVALFGGIAVFGLMGLVAGPVIAGMSVAILRTYERELPGREELPPAS